MKQVTVGSFASFSNYCRQESIDTAVAVTAVTVLGGLQPIDPLIIIIKFFLLQYHLNTLSAQTNLQNTKLSARINCSCDNSPRGVQAFLHFCTSDTVITLFVRGTLVPASAAVVHKCFHNTNFTENAGSLYLNRGNKVGPTQ